MVAWFTGGWYDFTVAAAAFERRFAGRLETGQDSVSDPAMGMTAVEDSVLSESAATEGSLLGEVPVPETSRQRRSTAP